MPLFNIDFFNKKCIYNTQIKQQKNQKFMSNLIVIALIVFVLVVIAVIEFYELYMRVIKKNKKYAELLSESRKQTCKLTERIKSCERNEKILKELIIFSHVGFEPSRDEKMKMIQNLLNDIQAVRNGRTERNSYKTQAAVDVGLQLNEVGDILVANYSSLQDLLMQSISENRSLYQELVDYIYFFGIDFCGRHEERQRKIVDTGRLVYPGHLDE